MIFSLEFLNDWIPPLFNSSLVFPPDALAVLLCAVRLSTFTPHFHHFTPRLLLSLKLTTGTKLRNCFRKTERIEYLKMTPCKIYQLFFFSLHSLLSNPDEFYRNQNYSLWKSWYVYLFYLEIFIFQMTDDYVTKHVDKIYKVKEESEYSIFILEPVESL